MVPFLSSLVGCPGHAQLGRDCPCGFAAPSAAGADKGMGDAVGNDSLCPITGCAQLTGQPFHLGAAGTKPGHGHKGSRSEVSAQWLWDMIFPLVSQGHLQPGTRLPPAAQHLPAPLGCPSQNMDPPPVPLIPLSSDSAATNLPLKLSSFSPREKQRGWSLPQIPGDTSPSTPKTAALRASTCSGNAATASTEASPPPGTAWEVPAGLREGAEPPAPSGAHVCQKYRVAPLSWNNHDGVTRSHVEPSSSSSWFSPCRIWGAESSMGGLQHPQRPH